MRPTSRSVSLIAGSFITLATVLSVAQNPAANSGRKPPMGYVRVWHFAPSMKATVSVSLFGGASPVILGRTMAPSDLLNYREVPPGQYRLSVRSSASDLNVSEKDPEVLPPTNIVVTDKGFQTVILQDDAKGAKVLVADDSIVGTSLAKGGKRLRIFNFAAGQDASLRTTPSNEVISPRVPPGYSEHIFSANPGTLMLVMSNKLRNGHEAEQSVEANFNAADSISALIMFDQYGRLTLREFEDAKAN